MSCATLIVPGPLPSNPVSAAKTPCGGSLMNKPSPGSSPAPPTCKSKNGSVKSCVTQLVKSPVSNPQFVNGFPSTSSQSCAFDTLNKSTVMNSENSDNLRSFIRYPPF